jgi:hypothetical protein
MAQVAALALKAVAADQAALQEVTRFKGPMPIMLLAVLEGLMVEVAAVETLRPFLLENTGVAAALLALSELSGPVAHAPSQQLIQGMYK